MANEAPRHVLPDLSAQLAQMQAMIAAQAAEIARLSQPKRLTLKVSEKGALSLYGMGQWPVTLYASQWRALIAAIPEVEAFMKANASKLTEKPAK